MEIMPEEEVLQSEKSPSIPRRYTRRNRGHRKHHVDDGDQAETCDVNYRKKSPKKNHEQFDVEDKITKPASISVKPSSGSKRKVTSSLENDEAKTLDTCTEDGCSSKYGKKSHVDRHVRAVHRKE